MRVDDGLCMGAQRCVYLAPKTFALDATGVAVVLDTSALPEVDLIEVARQCPNFAIIVVRDGEVLVGEE
ncbi:MAG: ferredoxin [Actinomycetota bacterium]